MLIVILERFKAGEKRMQKRIDWLLLWRQIVEENAKGRNDDRNFLENGDVWLERARNFDSSVKKRWNRPDSSREFITGALKRLPGSTLLDIGAGTGSWSCEMSEHAGRVTALDPSSAMISVMEENIRVRGITNIDIVQGFWPDTDVAQHDFSLCSHAMYGVEDLRGFIEKMVSVTRKTCFLLLRAPLASGVMAEASMEIWGHPYDSPNFPIAYNALLQMDIHANVLMEDTGLWKPWTSKSIDEAVDYVKQKFGISSTDMHDDFLRDLLIKRLEYSDGEYVWPRGVRSSLVYWDVD